MSEKTQQVETKSKPGDWRGIECPRERSWALFQRDFPDLLEVEPIRGKQELLDRLSEVWRIAYETGLSSANRGGEAVDALRLTARNVSSLIYDLPVGGNAAERDSMERWLAIVRTALLKAGVTL